MVKDWIKAGIGWTVGCAVAGALEWGFRAAVFKAIAKDPKKVAWCEQYDPELYEKVKRYL